MTEEGHFDIWLNPLQWFVVDYAGIGDIPAQPGMEDIFQFVCLPGTEYSIDSFIERYKQINQETPRWSLPPNEQKIMQKMVWPLRQAKANYVLGNYLATVVLCGMAAEMACILIFEISSISINGQPITQKSQEHLFGSSFERLRQSRRVKVLRAYDIIDDDLVARFDKVAASRNKYLHNWSVDYDNLADEAREAYLATVEIAVQVTGQQIDAGRVFMNPSLVRYLQDRGVYRPKDAFETE